jgi:dihydrolipoamide dehydrogenase
MKYDLLILGSGPGGYVAAIRASQLGMKVGVVEKSELGGVCLNWGCIPTKALLKSAQAFQYIKNADHYGLPALDVPAPEMSKIVRRSRDVAARMSKGIEFLFKKNKIDTIHGFGKLISNTQIEVQSEEERNLVEASKIIIATGSSPKYLPGIEADGMRIINFRQAMTLDYIPESMLVIGSGAIGSEFAYLYHSLGTKVTLVEYFPTIVPLEDEEAGKSLARSFKKNKMKVITGAAVKAVDIAGELCQVRMETKRGEQLIEAEIVLSAVGVQANISNIGLEKLGVKIEKGKIAVDNSYQTNVNGIYAIGDVIDTPALAHVASAEAIACVEKMAGKEVPDVDYTAIPAAVYTSPELASVGLTEKEAREKDYELKIGNFPFRASGKATAAGNNDGFVKLIFDAKTDLLLGAHLLGDNVSEIIAELVVAKKSGMKAHDIIRSIHPHPSMSEAVMEAAAAAYDEVIHL